MYKTIGIIGGMGPMATVDLMKKIILSTKATADQEHIPIVVDNNTNIPDRTAAILGKGSSPVPELIKSAQRLEAAGADFIIIGCNTAHYFIPQFADSVKIPIISMIEATANYCRDRKIDCVALLATEGTYTSGIYEKAFATSGVQLLIPSEEQKAETHRMIYDGVKANNLSFDASKVVHVLKELQDSGAQAFILGCTETPLAVEMYNLPGSFIDATQILAETAIKAAGAEVI